MNRATFMCTFMCEAIVATLAQDAAALVFVCSWKINIGCVQEQRLQLSLAIVVWERGVIGQFAVFWLCDVRPRTSPLHFDARYACPCVYLFMFRQMGPKSKLSPIARGLQGEASMSLLIGAPQIHWAITFKWNCGGW